MEASPHPLQAERLDALRSYEILDTEPEKDFDDIARLAAAICGTPVAAVNLIDAKRQWFKAETGLGLRETPLAASICAHVILTQEFVEIRDTLDDPRLAGNPLCIGTPGLRFYAGALLKTEDGLPIGTLCVLDHQPRVLTPLQRDAIRVLARQVMAQLEMRKALRVAKLLRQEVDHRVKNSLQSLSSFVRIRGRALTSPEAKAALADVEKRIAAASLVHELLYRTDAGPKVDLAQYLRNLGHWLQDAAPTGTGLVIKADPVMVGSQQAVAVGTLISEFAANAFKHAFPGERHGTVTISARQNGDGTVDMTCADDGVGLRAGQGQDPGGLGMKIAEIVCIELQCELDIASTPAGTSVGFRFRPELPTPEAPAG